MVVEFHVKFAATSAEWWLMSYLRIYVAWIMNASLGKIGDESVFEIVLNRSKVRRPIYGTNSWGKKRKFQSLKNRSVNLHNWNVPINRTGASGVYIVIARQRLTQPSALVNYFAFTLASLRIRRHTTICLLWIRHQFFRATYWDVSRVSGTKLSINSILIIILSFAP